jgi:transposase
VDEISYRRGQRYLTSVVDHHARAIVWCAPGRETVRSSVCEAEATG